MPVCHATAFATEEHHATPAVDLSAALAIDIAWVDVADRAPEAATWEPWPT